MCACWWARRAPKPNATNATRTRMSGAATPSKPTRVSSRRARMASPSAARLLNLSTARQRSCVSAPKSSTSRTTRAATRRRARPSRPCARAAARPTHRTHATAACSSTCPSRSSYPWFSHSFCLDRYPRVRLRPSFSVSTTTTMSSSFLILFHQQLFFLPSQLYISGWVKIIVIWNCFISFFMTIKQKCVSLSSWYLRRCLLFFYYSIYNENYILATSTTSQRVKIKQTKRIKSITFFIFSIIR